MVYIYALVCPISDAVRYIGKSINPAKRLRAHIGGAIRLEYNHHTSRWIRKLIAENKQPILRILQEVKSCDDWRKVERAWIKRALDECWPITNSTAGGEGLDYLNPEDEIAYRRNHAKAMEKFRATDRGKALLKNLIAAAHSPEARLKAADSIRKAYKNPETKKRLAESMARVRKATGYKAKRSSTAKNSWANHRAAFMAAFALPETKAKQSESKRRSWSDPKARARLMNRWTPEARALQSQRIRDRQALIQSKMTPEIRAKQGATLKATWAKRKATQ